MLKRERKVQKVREEIASIPTCFEIQCLPYAGFLYCFMKDILGLIMAYWEEKKKQGPKRHQPWPSSQSISAYSRQFQPFGAIWSYLFFFGSYVELFRAIQSYIELFGAIWSQLVPFGAIWSYLQPFGSVLRH